MDAGAVAMDSEDGKSYSSRKEMWLQEAGEDAETSRDPDLNKKDEWYQNGIKYWTGVEATVDGVLGGYGNVSSWDVMESDRFLLDVLSECMPDYVRGNRHLVALDCGAGVGRVTKQLLLRHFHEVDLVEPVQHFLETARRDLKSHILESNVIQDHSLHRVVNFFATPLQNFTPEPNRYDVIWVQWCIGHLTDQDFVTFFLRAKVGLKPDGLFVLKENVSKCGMPNLFCRLTTFR
ncbi:hypothetical protein O6H91_06G044900 [Diphasiastrum complanatum]|uniref:Uncharacterized protein n=1 Tax=Diphasiastrum complanatum TaxID=34168 RepID=A0ACC2DD46_DIPCM|nr:hypothetical protein O6H91_06G044900 [Diphasiastrum complanatum]